jgi:SAM-dependent methyltransferase
MMDYGKDENSGVEYTGERMIPGKADDENYYEHLARYRFAAQLIRGKRVLDAGCGDGYGSAMLAESASEVVGIDIAEDVIRSASAGYTRPNLHFKPMNVEEISLEPASFDAVISFEVFEHIHHPEKLLDGVKAVLKPGGIFVVSTPNGALVTSGKPNPYHVREYTLDEFQGILYSRFPIGDFSYRRIRQFNLRRRTGMAKRAIEGWVKLKRKLGIGKIMPDSVSRKIKDKKQEPYSIDDFAFSEDNIADAEYFIFVISAA